ncbi:MAG: hypothetical protein B7Z55_16620 [Planctomycetales bacterium 12-60-4]|nr:MAG: hypothetical protein B7Z55_16620 [Planctomycetales bacterium 12-60-4]
MAVTIALASFCSGIAGAPPWAATIDLGGRSAAVVMGLMNSISALAGIAISPLVGRFIDWLKHSNGDWTLVLWLHAGFHVLSAASWILVNPDRCLDPEESSNTVSSSPQ